MRKIVHIDMDAFYAAIEQRDFPEYRGKPLVVGGKPGGRGVVATASYEARAFGIHSAMPTSQAFRRCPQAIFVKPRMDAYREASARVMQIFRSYTDLIEPLSLDEAYLDVTENKVDQPIATELAKQILSDIFQQTCLTASAGVAPNKFLAKVASDINKPNGLFVIPPQRVDEFLVKLDVGKIPGIGKKTEAKMFELGIRTVGDLRAYGENHLNQLFGKRGSWFYSLARGLDEREVKSHRVRKSLSVENTFSSDLIEMGEITEKIDELLQRFESRVLRRRIRGRTLTLKITYSDFTKITRSKTLISPIDDSSESIDLVRSIALELLKQTEAGKRPLRLLGIGIGNLSGNEESIPRLKPIQLSLFVFND